MIWLATVLLFIAVGAGIFVWTGAYNVAADEPHWALTARLLETVRERSIAARISGISVPGLGDEAQIRSGAGNYDEMCADCHRYPGEDEPELGGSLNPEPPDFSRHRVTEPAEAFWVIKHGIKMTGMPAWGKHMDDDTIWAIVVLLRQLPDLSQERYRALVDASEGHSHGGGGDREAEQEDEGGHVHDDDVPHDH
jgi:mono/diheme cytochrome c family protein